MDAQAAQTALNTLDYVVIFIILFSGGLAIFNGLVREVYALFNWVVSGFIAASFYTWIDPLTQKYIGNPTTSKYVSIFVLFCLVFTILGFIGATAANRLLQDKRLTAIDRSLGLAFGLVRGFLIACILYLVAMAVLWPGLDKPPEPPSLQTQPLLPAEEAKKKAETPPPPLAPSWIMNAKTRPVLAAGAHQLRAMLPDDLINKATGSYMEKKDTGVNKINKTLDPGGEWAGKTHTPKD